MYLSKFEQLPDEIILEICVYLKIFDIMNGFGRLNGRLERTISHFRRNADTHHLTLSEYRQWCSYILPSVAKDIRSLVLSNWNSPGQIRLFNESTKDLPSLHQLLPNLEQLRLIDFGNEDTDILPKLAKIDRILIDVDAVKPLLHSTKLLFDRYLFCSSFFFREIRLWIGEGGIGLQHSTARIVNPHLERLTIVLARIDDLIVLFQRAPNLRKLCVEISTYSSSKPQQYIVNEIMPQQLTHFHIQTNDKRALIFDDLFVILIHIPTIVILSIDIETSDMDYADGLCWTFLISRLPNLEHIFFKTRIWMGTGTTSIDVEPFVKSFIRTNLPVICYADKRVLYIDTVPYDMHAFETNMSVTTSPSAKYTKKTNTHCYQRRARGVQSLFVCGRHEETSIDDWLYILNRFPCIQALDLTAVNMIDQTEINEQICLPNLIALRYVRSTRCLINISFFLYLAADSRVTPNLRALTTMYGDLIYLCKRLPEFSSTRLKDLWLFGTDADGRIVMKDVSLLMKAFPNLYHFCFLMQSSRAINRHVQQIIEMIVSSSPKLISFRILCRKGSFELSFLDTSDKQKAWIKRISGFEDYKQIRLTINEKEVSFWK